MKLLGFEITVSRSAATARPISADARGGWFPIVRESYPGAWQQNVEVTAASVLTFAALYACVTLIATDIGKLRLKLVQRRGTGAGTYWEETSNPAYSPVLHKPNAYQTRIHFLIQWITSKLIHGNTYALKARDGRGIVTALYILNPTQVRVLLAPDGAVFYELTPSALARVEGSQAVVVPAREIIHDLAVPLYHPLIGVSPISACGLSAAQGLQIQANSTRFFANGSNPGGLLSAPGAIAADTAARLKEYWDTNFSGDNTGKVAVLGDGLKYEPMSVNPVDAQLLEQLRWTSENVATAFHVPPYMVGIGPSPTFNNIESLQLQYYSQCLQWLIESLEVALDEGLGLGADLGTELDLAGLARMDTPTKIKAAADAVKAGFLQPNEARARFDLPPTEGGDACYLQQQNYSLAALAARDAAPAPSATPAATPVDDPPDDEVAAAIVDMVRESWSLVR